MMVISHKLRIVHIHVPKTGGTTINSVLKEWDTDALSLTMRPHEPISFVAQAYPEVFNSYIKIATVRNPWARTASLYHYRKVLLKTNRAQHWPTHWPSKDEVASMSFHDFVEKGAKETPCETCPPSDAKRIVWLEPSCLAWISIDGAISVDRVLRTETLAKDLSALCSELGLSATVIPQLNQSHSGSYHSYYDISSCAHVAERYRKDVDAFGYTFGLP